MEIHTLSSSLEILLRVLSFIEHVIATTTLDQVMLGILGVTAVRLSQDHRESVQKWACVFGLCGQPFWLYATFSRELWVMFLICILYTHSWWKGFKRWHLMPFLIKTRKNK